MNVLYEPRLTARELRNFLEALRDGADLAHFLVIRHLAPLPGFGGETDAGRTDQDQSAAVARGLRAFWRRHFLPPVLSSERRTAWNYYFLLEVMYFFPYAHGRRYPETLKDAAVLLCDEAHLALIVANGDEAEAAQLLQANRTFWKGIVPATMIPAQQTIYSRRNAALEKLATALNRQRPKGALMRLVLPADPIVVAGQPLGESEQNHGQVERGTPIFDAQLEPLSPGAARLRAALAWASPSTLALQRPPAQPEPRATGQVYLDRLVRTTAQITPAQLDELALWLWPLGFPQSFGVKRAVNGGAWWWDEVYHQRQLVEQFTTSPDDGLRIQCAAALRQSSLAVLVKDANGLWPFGDYRWVPALEAVASVLVQHEPGTVQHTLAAAILSKPSTLLQLSVREGDCRVACQYLAVFG